MKVEEDEDEEIPLTQLAAIIPSQTSHTTQKQETSPKNKVKEEQEDHWEVAMKVV